MYFRKLYYPVFFFFFPYCCIQSTPLLAQHFKAIQSKEGVEINENGKRVLFYQVKPKALDGKYERSGYIHPLYSLKGNIMTEDFPADHPYHHGIFWAWHQIILAGKKVADGWTSDSISWRVGGLKIMRGKNKISLIAQVNWITATDARKPVVLIKEKTIITINAENKNQRVIDFDIRLLPRVDSISIAGSDDMKGYGGFCLRLKLPPDIEFVSNDSLVTPRETAIDAGQSMDFRGSFDGLSAPKSGVILITTPIENDTQQSWILRKEGSMQNIVYPGRTPVRLPKTGLRMRYQLIIH